MTQHTNYKVKATPKPQPHYAQPEVVKDFLNKKPDAIIPNVIKENTYSDIDEEIYRNLYDQSQKTDTYEDFSIKVAWFLTSENMLTFDNFLQNQRKVRKFLRKVDTMDLAFCKKELLLSPE